MRLRSLAIQLILVLAWESAESQPASPADPLPASAPVAKPAEGKCIKCHGPFDKLIKAPAKYIAPGGEKINPHRDVPGRFKASERYSGLQPLPRGAQALPSPAKVERGVAKRRHYNGTPFSSFWRR